MMKPAAEAKSYGIFSTPANQKIIADLENSGSTVFYFPPVETKMIDEASTGTFVKDHFAEFDWLIFPDVFAVEYFFELLEACAIDFYELDEKRIVALGEAVSDRLRFRQIHADVVPNSVETTHVFAALTDYVQLDALSEITFLLPKFAGCETGLEELLTNAGARITELEIFEAILRADKETARLKALLSGGAVDAFVFASSEDVFFLRFYGQTVNRQNSPAETEFLAIGETAFQSLREHGLRAQYFFSNKKRG